MIKKLLCTMSVVGLSHLALAEDAKKADEEGFVAIFDGKSLKGWTAARSDKEGDWGAFSVNEEEKAIHVYAGQEQGSKQQTDCLNTVAQYSNYILRLEYKWLENRFAPRADWDRDAGLLFHVHDDLKKVWPHCMEMQIGETPGDKFERRRYHTGDLFVLGNHLRATTPREGKRYKAGGKLTKGKHVATPLGVEKPKGEWNEMEIRIEGSKKATFILNGEVVHEVFKLEQKNDEGKYVPLTKGHIGLQAEWAELLYRNIRIKEMPAMEEKEEPVKAPKETKDSSEKK